MNIRLSMLAPERQQQILAILEKQGTVRTVDLAREFRVTDETIRRDLQSLEETHRVSRVHGGASSLNGRPKLQSFAERRSQRVSQKRAIAQRALELVEPGGTYAFDSSTTGFELVCALPDLPFRVITNAYAVLDQLVRYERVELLSTGGRYHPKTQTFVPGDASAVLRRHNINRAFVSCIGLDPRRGASEGFEEQAEFKESLIRVAEEVVLLVDSAKCNRRSEYFFAGLDELTHIITDDGAPAAFVRALRASGRAVTVVKTGETPAVTRSR